MTGFDSTPSRKATNNSSDGGNFSKMSGCKAAVYPARPTDGANGGVFCWFSFSFAHIPNKRIRFVWRCEEERRRIDASVMKRVKSALVDLASISLCVSILTSRRTRQSTTFVVGFVTGVGQSKGRAKIHFPLCHFTPKIRWRNENSRRTDQSASSEAGHVTSRLTNQDAPLPSILSIPPSPMSR